MNSTYIEVKFVAAAWAERGLTRDGGNWKFELCEHMNSLKCFWQQKSQKLPVLCNNARNFFIS